MSKLDIILLALGGFNVLLSILLVWVFILYRRLNRKISGIGANVAQNIVDEGTLIDWKQFADKHGPNTNKGIAIRNKLKEVGHPYHGD